ncbi:peroxisomal membrane protein PEX14-like isoform X2 [Phragmites australis]|uniref:peroxisomal membrane protein PEX14-like isoform X2 n=1 Tax=Phragmites australis TaxID=29695 RepID=UPI002D7A3E77|nr:peroxisomal membrane protein PEX14-like isoform X2 [Phragmites australis]
MADVSTSSDAEVAEEARQQEAGQGSSEGIHTTTLQDTKEQEIRKGKAALASFELMREELVQSAVGFLKHPKVVASSDVQRLSFLENKGLTVDEINEAFRRLQSPSSNSVSSNMCTSLGVSDRSCRITQETKVVPKCMDGEKLEPETEPVAPVVPHHPKSYMEIMEMIQRGERPDDIQDINDNPPNPDQPISEPRMAPKPKPWEKQDQENSTWDLKSLLSDSSELRPEVGNDSTHPATESANGSNQGDSLLQTIVVVGSESPTTDAASSK